MYSHDELTSLFDYLKSTPEAPLRKMLVSGKLTESHFRILLKVVRSVNQADFISAIEKNDLPRLRLTPQETKLKETFWTCCFENFRSVGLITKEVTSEKAAA